MLDILEKVEKELPNLLDKDDWNSVDINYHPPRVERVWRQWNYDYRINLHRLHPCAESQALFHPHPWPSVVKIIHGGYWTKLGKAGWSEVDWESKKSLFSRDPIQYISKPYPSHKLFVGPGSILVDTSPVAWHSVAPTEVTYSIMVTGKPWDMSHWKEGLVTKPHAELKSIDEESIKSIKKVFQSYYRKENDNS